MLYLGACNGASPPVCVPCLSPCCEAWLASGEGGVFNSDVFAEVWAYFEAPSPWRSGLSASSGLGVPVTITGISHTLTIPSDVTATSVCGPLVTSASEEDFSDLVITRSGNAVTISGSAVVIGANETGNPAGIIVDLRIGVICTGGGRTYLVVLRWTAHENEVLDIQDLTSIIPYDCADPCLSNEAAYAAGYADGLACLEQADPCAGTCPDCSSNYLDGWTAGRAAAGGCAPCGDYYDGYNAGYLDGVACAASADPCGEACGDCSAGYADGYADGLIDGAC